MAGNKYLKLSSGQLAEEAAVQASAGAGDAGKIPALDAAGKLANSMMPVGIGPDTKSMVASEALAANDLVNVYNDAGTEKCRKADATNGRRANGFVLDSVAGGGAAVATVYTRGTVTGLSGKTPGAVQYLSSTAGLMTATAPSTAGYLVQEVGAAISPTEVAFEPKSPITLA